MNIFESLMSKGWIKETLIPYKEAVAKEASECYTYSNQKNSIISILPIRTKSLVRIRLSGARGNQFNYFEIKTNGDEVTMLETIDGVKDEADIQNYFSFYFSLQAAGEVSILAWEQWETNYR